MEVTPHIPLTPEEIADDTYVCRKAGAAVVHLHMHGENGQGNGQGKIQNKAAGLVSSRRNVVINLTTSGAARNSARPPPIPPGAGVKPQNNMLQ